MTLVAIHQPTFLPWLGWWDKLVRADVLVLLDDVQFPKKGGTWMNRVRMLVGGEPRWVTVPVDRAYSGTRRVREMRIDDSKPWRENMLATIRGSYARAPFVDEVRRWSRSRSPSARPRRRVQGAAIELLAGRLGLDTSKLVYQSELGVSGDGTQLLVKLCRAVGGDTYLSGTAPTATSRSTRSPASAPGWGSGSGVHAAAVFVRRGPRGRPSPSSTL